MTNKYPLPGCCLTGEEIAAMSREKIAAMTNEEASEVLNEVESEQFESDDESFEVIPKTAEDQEAFGVGIYQGTQECSRRFNELATIEGVTYEDVMSKIAEEIEAFDAETAALRDAATANPNDELLADMVEKIAEEDPQALADFAAQRLSELGYEIKTADDDEDVAEGVEDEEEETEETAS